MTTTADICTPPHRPLGPYRINYKTDGAVVTRHEAHSSDNDHGLTVADIQFPMPAAGV